MSNFIFLFLDMVLFRLLILLRVNILDVIFDKKLKRHVEIYSNDFDDLTYRIGKGNGRIKIL